ncbi:hypothetical protein EON64_18700 [archaeon]|nr:MAG: hypothetical protein EON64_18700 [archaeon]
MPNERRKRAVMSVRLSSDWQQMSTEELASLTLSSAANVSRAASVANVLSTSENNTSSTVKEEET